MQPLFFDEFNIDEQYHKLKHTVSLLEPEVYKFISPTKNRQAARRSRKLLQEVRKLALELRKSIAKQTHHNNSQY